MRVLFYGGCHAGVLQRIFQRWGPQDCTFDVIMNYELIGSGKPFPYDWVRGFDIVVYSPIVNKNEYNTSELQNFCEINGIKCISYPWIQWNGYFPFAEKRTFLGVNYWYTPSAPIEGPDCARFIKNSMEITTQRLCEHESNTNTTIKVSPFIQKYYQRAQLFLTPDHPSNLLYRYVARELSNRLAMDLQHEFFRFEDLLQPELLLPILPVVADALQLKFPAPNEYVFRIGAKSFTLFESEYDEFGRTAEDELRIFSSLPHAQLPEPGRQHFKVSAPNDGATVDSYIGKILLDHEDKLTVSFLSGQVNLESGSKSHVIEKSNWQITIGSI